MQGFLNRAFGRGPRRPVPEHPGRTYQPTGIYTGQDRILSRLWTGHGIFLPASDLGVGPSIMMTGRWEPLVTEYIIGVLKPGDVFVDIGANIGYYSVLAAALVQPTGFVVAFEPQKDLHRFLADSLTVNGLQSLCDIGDVAIGDAEGVARLNQVASMSASASLIPSTDAGRSRDGVVEVRTLDAALADISAIRERRLIPTMIKIDIEGYEYRAWTGMKRTLAQADRMTLIIEFAPRRYMNLGEDPFGFLDELEAAGFSIGTLRADGRSVRTSPLPRSAVQAMIDQEGGVDIVAVKGGSKA